MQPQPWYLLQTGSGDAAFNMALDEALLQAVPRLARPVLRFYAWTEPAASFGYFQRYADIEQMTSLRPLVRRPTGGGLVPHDADWTYSLVFPPMHDWYRLRATDSYRRVHEWIRDAFAQLDLSTELAPARSKTVPGQCFQGYEVGDVLWRGRKIAGAAQRRTRDGLLIQGSVQPRRLALTRGDWEEAMCEAACAEQGIRRENSPDCNSRFEPANSAAWSADIPVGPRRGHAKPTGMSALRAVHWEEFAPDAALAERAHTLAQQKYSQASYNQQR